MDGRQRAREEFGVVIAWMVELVRGAPNEANERALDIALATEGVVGIGLVGDESIPSGPLAPLIQRAGQAGLGFMPHAGQVGAGLCICPSSNARIGLTPDYATLAANGIQITVNTDDPAMIPTTLETELEMASARYGLNRQDLVTAAWKHRFQAS